jgi:ABC-2 type transport system permease protein/oleandomycin transport system permease protein
MTTTTTATTVQPTIAIDAARRSPRSGLRDTLVVSRRNLRHIIRTPQLLAFASLLPISFTLLFRYVLGGAVHTHGQRYIDYMLPTMLVLSTMFGATGAIAMAVDITGGMIERFRSLPIARAAVLSGRTVADLGRAALTIAIVLAVGTLIGFRFHNGAVPALAAIGVVLVFSFAMSWEMAWIGMKVKDAETAQVAAFLPIFLLVFASSGFVPIDTMPPWLQAFARNQPFTAAINAVRALSQGGPIYHWLWLTAAWTAGILAVFVTLAIREYRKL